jgi:hypothetical protein
MPKFPGEVGSYGNAHWTKFCEGYEFHQYGKEHTNTFMRLFLASHTGSVRDWINTLPSGSPKTPEYLEHAFLKIWGKVESMASIYS